MKNAIKVGSKFRFLGDHSNVGGVAEVTGLALDVNMVRVTLNQRVMFVPVAVLSTARWVRL